MSFTAIEPLWNRADTRPEQTLIGQKLSLEHDIQLLFLQQYFWDQLTGW